MDAGQTQSLKALVFDVDGTLYKQHPLRRAMMLRLARAYALRPRQGRQTMRILSAYRKAQEMLRETEYAGSDLTQAQLQIAVEKTGYSQEIVLDCVQNWMDREPLPILARFLHSSLVELLETARKEGLRLAVCSDYPAESKLEALKLRPYFDVIAAAQEPEVGVFKPHPRGLEVALQRLGVPASQALYIGDRPEVDALAAQRAAMRCVIVTNAGPAPPNASWQQVQNYAELRRLLFSS